MIQHSYQAILSLVTTYTVSLLCSIANVSRSGYYKWLANRDNQKHTQLIEILKHEQDRLKGIYGYRRMKTLLHEKYQLTANHKLLQKLMKTHDLLAVIRRKKPKFRVVQGENLIAKNILDRNFKTKKLNEKYVTDITYIPIPNSMVYLSAVLDLCNLEVVSYKISTNADTNLSLDCIKTLAEKASLKGTIIHSDQGIHYTNYAYHELLKQYEVKQSMSRRGNCWDNAMAENFFGHFKCECYKIYKRAMNTFEDVIEIVDEYIHFYNHERPQKKLKNLSPVSYKSLLQNET